MRKKLIACFLLLCLLCGCAAEDSDAMQSALRLRGTLLARGGCSFCASVTADWGDTVDSFDFDCVYGETGLCLTVTAPETLAGICASVCSDQKASIRFDDTELALELLGGRLSPLASPLIFCQAWAQDYLALAGREKDLLRITAIHGYDEQELYVDTWLDDGGIPLHCEISIDGKTVIFADISNFRWIEDKNENS